MMRPLFSATLVILAVAACGPGFDFQAPDTPELAVVDGPPRLERDGSPPDGKSLLLTEEYGCIWVGSAYYSCVERPQAPAGDTVLVQWSIMRDGVHQPIDLVKATAKETGFFAAGGAAAAEGDVVVYSLLDQPYRVFVLRDGVRSSFATEKPAAGSLLLRNGEVTLGVPGRDSHADYSLDGRRLR
jgi:hypothetical protein